LKHLGILVAPGLIAGLVGCAPEVPKQLQSGFKMAEHSMAFANFATGYDGSAMDAELLQRMFGDAVCRPGSSPCALTPAAQAFIKKANKSMAGGRCEGFAVMAELFQGQKLNPVDFGGQTARDLTLADNLPLQRELAYWFSTQLVPAVSSKQTKGYMAKDVMPALVKALSQNATERYRLGIVQKKGTTISGGHALTPIGYAADPTEKGVYWLRVYDNNQPDTERKLKIDTVNNRWEFEASENPALRSRLYFGDASNKNPLYLAPVFNRTGTLSCPFCTGGSSVISTTGGAQASVKGLVGVIAGELAGGTSPNFSLALDDQPAEFNFEAEGGDQTVDVEAPVDNDHPGASQTVTVQAHDFEAQAYDLDITQKDQLNVSADGTRTSYVNNSRTSLGLRTQVTLPAGGSLSVSAVLNGSSTDVTATVDKSSGTVSVGAGGSAGSQVTMVVTNTDEMGRETTGQLTFTSEGDGGVTADTRAWMAGAPLTGTVTNNGTTTTVTNACEDGVKSGMESDVDCGAVCNLKCSVGQGCGTGNDCQSTWCNQTTSRCVVSSCDDGRKSGDETDADCGGSCGACAIGAACTRGADCAGTAACSGGICRATFVVGVALSGLPTFSRIVLQNNGADDLPLSGDGSYFFPKRVTGGYAVSVKTQPQTGTCTVTSGTGTATANVVVQVTCTPTFAVSGTVSGLPSGESVTLAQGSESVMVNADGLFGFTTRVLGLYAVTVQTQPASATCVVTNGSGTAAADVSNVTVTCTATPTGFLIGGTVSGLPIGQSVTLQNNGADSLQVLADGAFTFSARATNYSVTVQTQPTSVRCAVRVGTGSGTASNNVSSVVVVCAVSGALDFNFNTVGWLTSSRTPGSDFWVDGVVNSDDSLVLVGQVANGAFADWVVSKVRSNGTFDPAFGTGGHLAISTGSAIQYPRGIFIDGTGYLIVGSLAGATNADLGIARVTASGALDTAFGTNGTATFDTGQVEYIEDGVRDAQGRIVLVGRASVSGAGPHDALLARLTPNGQLDPTFGTAGFVFYDSGGDDSGTSVTIDPATGDIIAVVALNANATVLRFDGTGMPVNTFGTNGVAVIDLSGTGGADWPYRVAMSGTGVLIVGWASPGATQDLAVVKVTSTGTIDTAFGASGRLLINRGGNEVGYAIMPSPQGGWYVGGHSDTSMLVTRISATGVVDTTFSTNGYFQNVIANSALAYHLLLDSQQRVCAVGTIRLTGSEDLGVVRLTP